MPLPTTPRPEPRTLARFRRRMQIEAARAGYDPEQFADAMVMRWGEKILAASRS